MSADRLIAGENIGLLHGPEHSGSALLLALQERGIILREIGHPDELAGSTAALLLLDASLLQVAPLGVWQGQLELRNPDCLVLAAAAAGVEDIDLVLPAGLSVVDTVKLVRLALHRWVVQRENRQLQSLLDKTEQDLQMMTEIGIALSAERNLDQLLEKILSEAQNLACCDAASLFLVEKSENDQALLNFKLTRNDSIDTDFQEQKMELDRGSIAGYVAVTSQELNIPNAYEISSSEPYSFNPEIDRSLGYRTVSLLALPIRNYRGDTIGVLQFINRKTRRSVRLETPETALEETLPFHEAQIKILRALASQSAVAIENSVLLEDINQLFSGFVQAAVSAIEQRDPTTSGHSFRVADLTIELAGKLSIARIPEYRDVQFREQEIKELRYAALLHDFGKVGVREHILVKAKKLPERQFELIRYRIRLAQERLQRQMSDDLLKALQQDADPAHIRAVEEACRAELERLEKFLGAVAQANEPRLLDGGDFEHLKELREYPFTFEDEGLDRIISDDEFARLSVSRGSLTPEERSEIESHVVHTAEFLRHIPWTPELARIPEIAESHHEKLDGSGYPHGISAAEIPVGSKIMTICDIYDALTASDRPYKNAVDRDIAYRILQEEAAAGKLDSSLVDLFIEAEVYRVMEGKDYAGLTVGTATNHPCDPDFHQHRAP
jgi:HD-GYP domain-containing protein (c-di-GMP phosphodiesterase class II)